MPRGIVVGHDRANGAGDVVDMDAVEHLSRLDDALPGPGANALELAAPGPVDAG
jgi:hypothetical protein